MSTPSMQERSARSHPQSPAAMLAKSAVCVVVVVGLAWIGFASLGSSGNADPSVDANGAVGGIAMTGDRAAAHRRQVFEERRARFEGRPPAHMAQSETPAR